MNPSSEPHPRWTGAPAWTFREGSLRGLCHLARRLSALATLAVAALCHAPAAAGPDSAGALPSIWPQCERLYTPAWRPLAGAVASRVPDLERPPKGLAGIDPAHRTCVVRVTDHTAETSTGFVRHDYSRRQSFNADDTKVIMEAQNGTWHLYATADMSYRGKLPGLAGDAEPQWHPDKPNILRFLPITGLGMTIQELDVDTGKVSQLADLSKRVRALWPSAQALWTRSEGSPSRDHRYWAFQVDNEKWQGLGLVSYDLKEDRIVATYDLAKNGKGRPDHLSVSPSGKFIVVSWEDGVTAFHRDFSQPRLLQKKSEHSDLGVGMDGRDVYVAVDYQGRGGPVFFTDLETGKRTDLIDTYVNGTVTALHVSAQAFDRPGWVVVSTYADSGKAGPQWLHRRVFAMTLEAQPRIVHLAHHRSRVGPYHAEPQASTNRRLTRILFNSNWGGSADLDIEAYMVLLPARAYDVVR